MAARAPTVVQLYIKEECGLCEEMQADLQAFLLQYQSATGTGKSWIQLEIRDIEDNAEWMARYREYVPTVVVNDQEVCHYFFESEELEEALECPSHI